MKKRINITIDDKSLFIVDRMAKDRGIDRSTMITILIRKYDKFDYAGDYAYEYDMRLQHDLSL